MTTTPGDLNSETRSRLLEAAGEVFAEQGFRAATIRAICDRAKANVAAVNYHFGDKERLYAAVLRYAHHRADPRPRMDDPSAEPEQFFAGYVRQFLHNLLDGGQPAWLRQIMVREMVEPTSAFDRMIEEEFRPNMQYLHRMLRALFARYGWPEVSAEVVERAGFSVVGQILFYKHCSAVIGRLSPRMSNPAAHLDELAEHVTAFSLGAIRELARSKTPTPGGAP